MQTREPVVRCMNCGRGVPQSESRRMRECRAIKLCETCNAPGRRLIMLAKMMGGRRR
jgi:NAD-dependent SIR2 family protein deacetylase